MSATLNVNSGVPPNLPDFLLGAEIGAVIAQLLDTTVRCQEVFGCVVAFNINTSVLIVQLCIAFRQIVQFTTLHRELFLAHSVTVCKFQTNRVVSENNFFEDG